MGSGEESSQNSKKKWKLAYLLYKNRQNILGGSGVVFEDCQSFQCQGERCKLKNLKVSPLI